MPRRLKISTLYNSAPLFIKSLLNEVRAEQDYDPISHWLTTNYYDFYIWLKKHKCVKITPDIENFFFPLIFGENNNE